MLKMLRYARKMLKMLSYARKMLKMLIYARKMLKMPEEPDDSGLQCLVILSISFFKQVKLSINKLNLLEK